MHLPGFDEKEEENVDSVEDCQKECAEATEFACRSAEYNSTSKTCVLSSRYTLNLPMHNKGLMRSPGVDISVQYCGKSFFDSFVKVHLTIQRAIRKFNNPLLPFVKQGIRQNDLRIAYYNFTS